MVEGAIAAVLFGVGDAKSGALGKAVVIDDACDQENLAMTNFVAAVRRAYKDWTDCVALARP